MPVRRLWANCVAVLLASSALLADMPMSPTTADRMSPTDRKSDPTQRTGVRTVAQTQDSLTSHPTILRLLELHNQTRARAGLPPLVLNAEMCAAAQRHANWMASSGVFVHSGLPYRENIAYNQVSPEHAVQSWTYSPGHYANMCSGREAGFGYQVRGGAGYWVAVFR